MPRDSSESAAEEHSDLREVVEKLNQNVTVLWQAIDDVRELLEWAVENRRDVESRESQTGHSVLKRMAPPDPPWVSARSASWRTRCSMVGH